MRLFDLLTKIDNDEIFTVTRTEASFVLRDVDKAFMLGEHPNMLEMDIKKIELSINKTDKYYKPTFIFIV